MDDYMFIVLAKLEADRLKLEREARTASFASHPSDAQFTQRHSPRARRSGTESEGFQRDLLGEQS